jgi:1A family penicillin-binding protein
MIPRSSVQRWLRRGALATLIIGICSTAVVIRTYRSFPVHSKEFIINHKDADMVLYDREGRLFFAFDRARRKTVVPISDIPPLVRQAVLAAEDKEFYQHWGFSPRGIARSVYLNLEYQQLHFGGSTITQQLAKNAYLTPEKSFRRKFQELLVASKLERHYSKDDILEMYLNSAYFGRGVYGIEAAAETYFNKTTTELTLAEASFIAGLLRAPSALTSTTTPSSYSQKRQEYVLNQMVDAGFVTPKEAAKARTQTLVFHSAPTDLNKVAPHFALMVRDQLIHRFGADRVRLAGFKVITTLDLDWQKAAEEAARTHIATLRSAGASNAAAVVIEPSTGHIRALVGSADWHSVDDGMINMAIRPRQPGSTFKPIVYAAALEQHAITPATIIEDRPRTFGLNYRPRNYNNRYFGRVTVRQALANSLNIPAVTVASAIHPRTVVQMAQRFGISTIDSESANNLSIALGSEAVSLVELTSAYGTLGNNGVRQAPLTILEVRDKRDRVVYSARPTSEQVVSPETSFVLSSILSDRQARARTFGRALDLPFTVAVKTGTTQDFRDAWTVGYTPSLAVGVWIGNSNNKAMNSVAGSLGAAPLWKKLIGKFSDPTIQLAFVPPHTLVAGRNCLTGSAEYFLPGTEPRKPCPPRPTPSVSPEPTPPDSAIADAEPVKKPEKKLPKEKPESDEVEDSEEG